MNFPFEQALPAARALWGLAATIGTDIEPARQSAGTTALKLFSGNYAEHFENRLKTSANNASATIKDLESAALNIAYAWVDANHQQQLYRYYAMVKAKRDDRSLGEEIGGWISGDHTNYGKPPAAPEVPSPPGFEPTAVPQPDVPGEAAATVS